MPDESSNLVARLGKMMTDIEDAEWMLKRLKEKVKKISDEWREIEAEKKDES